jgi:thiamine biosynthesis protein ThiI
MKFVSLMSSGIDSPVATTLLAPRAEQIVLLHGDGRPFTDTREIDNFLALARHLSPRLHCDTKTYVVPYGSILSAYREAAHPRYTCVFCKRILVRLAERLAVREHADALIMGDSLGQVASQTLQNLRVVEQAVHLPILRPLIGYDKQEIIAIAHDIGTYTLSIVKSSGCQAVPHKPSTRARLEDVLHEEQKLPVDTLLDEAMNKLEEIKF